MSEAIKNRYEFVVLFDVENGNPNGDPDAGNMPRVDAETCHGIVTDVCLKRKIRNYIEVVKEETLGYKIYVKEGIALNAQHKTAYEHFGIKYEPKKLPKDSPERLTKFMCQNFFDIRTFGAVMTTDVNCGQVRGPVQFNFARSIDPIFQEEATITRQAVTSEKDLKEKKSTEMGRKHFVPYGLYRVEGYISAKLAQDVLDENGEIKKYGTGFSEEDLNLLFEAIQNMFEHDHSAARGKMVVRKFVIFKHENALGNAPSHKLFELINVQKKGDVPVPRSFNDYNVTVNKDATPKGVELIEREYCLA